MQDPYRRIVMYRLLLASVTLLLTTTAWADDCPHRAARDLDIDAAGLRHS